MVVLDSEGRGEGRREDIGNYGEGWLRWKHLQSSGGTDPEEEAFLQLGHLKCGTAWSSQGRQKSPCLSVRREG